MIIEYIKENYRVSMKGEIAKNQLIFSYRPFGAKLFSMRGAGK
jgi:hypothetical protein